MQFTMDETFGEVKRVKGDSSKFVTGSLEGHGSVVER